MINKTAFPMRRAFLFLLLPCVKVQFFCSTASTASALRNRSAAFKLWQNLSAEDVLASCNEDSHAPPASLDMLERCDFGAESPGWESQSKHNELLGRNQTVLAHQGVLAALAGFLPRNAASSTGRCNTFCSVDLIRLFRKHLSSTLHFNET
jgi:hypothetical protein